MTTTTTSQVPERRHHNRLFCRRLILFLHGTIRLLAGRFLGPRAHRRSLGTPPRHVPLELHFVVQLLHLPVGQLVGFVLFSQSADPARQGGVLLELHWYAAVVVLRVKSFQSAKQEIEIFGNDNAGCRFGTMVVGGDTGILGGSLRALGGRFGRRAGRCRCGRGARCSTRFLGLGTGCSAACPPFCRGLGALFGGLVFRASSRTRPSGNSSTFSVLSQKHPRQQGCPCWVLKLDPWWPWWQQQPPLLLHCSPQISH